MVCISFYGLLQSFNKPAVCPCTWTTGFGFWWFSWFWWACPSVCMYMNHWFWVLAVFMVLMGLSICVCVHGPTVLGFGGFHGFNGPVHDQNHENCQNPKPVVHVHAHRWTGPLKPWKPPKPKTVGPCTWHTDGQAHQKHQNPKLVVHIHTHTHMDRPRLPHYFTVLYFCNFVT